MSARMTKAALKAKAAFEQYSKKMATRVTVFWMIYRIVVAVLIVLRPEIANAMAVQIEGVDTVMIVNMSVYTGNSATEKVAIAFGKRNPRYGGLPGAEEKEDTEDEEQEESENG